MLLMLLSVVNTQDAVSEHQLEDRQSNWTTGLGAGALLYETDEEFNSTFILEGKAGYSVSDDVTLEGSVGYLPFIDAQSDTENDPTAWHLEETQAFRAAFDALYHLNEVGEIRPHLGATAGAIYYSNSLRGGDHWDPFVGVGAGVGVPINRDWTARADYRFLVVLDDGADDFNHHTLLSLLYRWPSRADHGRMSEVEKSDQQQVLELKAVHFDFDEATLTPQAQEQLKRNAEWLRENSNTRVTVEGHCDERGTNEYNLGLGERRARSVQNYLRALGVEASRMESISYGEERPAELGSNEAAWAKNRRVECVPIK